MSNISELFYVYVKMHHDNILYWTEKEVIEHIDN